MKKQFIIEINADEDIPELETLKENLKDKIEDLICEGLWLMEESEIRFEVNIK